MHTHIHTIEHRSAAEEGSLACPLPWHTQPTGPRAPGGASDGSGPALHRSTAGTQTRKVRGNGKRRLPGAGSEEKGDMVWDKRPLVVSPGITRSWGTESATPCDVFAAARGGEPPTGAAPPMSSRGLAGRFAPGVALLRVRPSHRRVVYLRGAPWCTPTISVQLEKINEKGPVCSVGM